MAESWNAFKPSPATSGPAQAPSPAAISGPGDAATSSGAAGHDVTAADINDYLRDI